MKKNLVVLSLVAAFILMASFGFAGLRTAMRVTIPFDFYAENQKLPAGEYTFEMTSGMLPSGSIVTIRSLKGRAICTLITRPGTELVDAKLLFNKYGNTHFLSTVSIEGFKASVRMQNLEKELRAQLRNQVNVVAIAQNLNAK
jgi:hypothetical protein